LEKLVSSCLSATYSHNKRELFMKFEYLLHTYRNVVLCWPLIAVHVHVCKLNELFVLETPDDGWSPKTQFV
jgi:hypothetical protein